MHAHDRTLLAQLGFADPDKRNPVHDLACRYLAQLDVARRVVEMMLGEWLTDREVVETDFHGRYTVGPPGLTVFQPKLEVPISKGENKYKTTIGFIDLIIPKHVKILKSGVNPNDGSKYEETIYLRKALSVEVKISEQSVNTAIRQINLYREYEGFIATHGFQWALATTYPISDAELDCFENEKIRHILLGEPFHEWMRREQESKAASSSDPNPSRSLVI